MPGDPYYNQRSLGLHLDGANNSTTFTDNSPTPKTVTALGNARISTSQFKYGPSSAVFDGVGDALTVPNGGAFDITSQGFTGHAWIMPTANPPGGYSTIFSTIKLTGQFAGYRLLRSNLGKMFLEILDQAGAAQYTAVGGGQAQLNAWAHIAVTYDGITYRVFLDGVLQGSLTIGLPKTPAEPLFYIGASVGDDNPFIGYIDDLYIVNTAIWTGNFTPPAAPFADYSDIDALISASTSAPIGDFIYELPVTFAIDASTSAPIGLFDFVAQGGATISASTGQPFGAFNIVISENLEKKGIIGRKWNAVLTGSPNIEIPISSINGRLRSVGDSTLTIICPDGINYAAEILARIGNSFKINAIEFYSDNTNETTESQLFGNLSVHNDRGGHNYSVTITGTAALNFPPLPRRINIGGIQYQALQANGARRIRASLDKDIKPKDIAVLPSGEEITVDAITYLIGTRQMSMELTEAA